MAEYRHITNMRVPFDSADIGLMLALGDYRIGAPVPAEAVVLDDGSHSDPLPTEELTRRGFVGLYAAIEDLRQPHVMRRTGWRHPERILGQAWQSADDRPGT